MTERERLIELLYTIIQPGGKTLGDIADYLLENGVNVPPFEEAEKALHKMKHNSLCETETYKIGEQLMNKTQQHEEYKRYLISLNWNSAEYEKRLREWCKKMGF